MNIFFDMIGCRLNQSEVESFANIFRALGHQIVGDPGQADIAIVNTCAVTVKAAADSRKKLRRAARKGAPRVVATGCWAALYPDEASKLEGVTDVISNDEKEDLVSKILGLSPDVISQLEMMRKPIPGDRGRTRAFIKVQEGCDNHCTYCLTRIARGKSKSRNFKEIKKDVDAALGGGSKEIVLTGVQLGAWGRDLPGSKGLADLLESLLSIEGYERLRLSSIEPWDFDTSLIKFWSDKRVCRHIHLPLQSGSDRILKAMGRPIRTKEYRELVVKIREELPGVGITTDVITGFPGETREDYVHTLNLIKSIGFSSGHVFTYSPRPGTAAYKMKDPVPVQIAKERNAELRSIFSETAKAFREKFIGEAMNVLWESSRKEKSDAWSLTGLTDNYIRVYSKSKIDLSNQITLVVMEGHHSQRGALIGSVKASADKPDEYT